MAWSWPAALALLALINGWHSGRLWPWELILAALFLSAASFRPALLHPLNRLWMKLGLLLHKIVNPIVMGLLFYGTIWPTGLVDADAGQGPAPAEARAGCRHATGSRAPAGAAPETMKDQF